MLDCVNLDGMFIDRRHFMKLSAALIPGLSLAQNSSAKHTERTHSKRPNVLLVIADQMTPLLMGLYGHPVVKTPHLNALAEKGVRFDTAYSPCPLCAPARASLLTGRYSSEIGVYDNAAPLACDQPTLCHYLNLLDYDTVLSGKVHFVGPDQNHGFQKRLLPNIYPSDFSWTKSRDNKIPKSHARSYTGEAIHVGRSNRNQKFDEQAHREALDYLTQKGKQKRTSTSYQPFFLCVSYNFPHEPFWPPKKYWDLYEGQSIEIPKIPPGLEKKLSVMDLWLNRHHGVDKIDLQKPSSLRKLWRAYFALVTYIDDKVGELIARLRADDLMDDTIIIFTSDHGDMLCEKNMVQKRCFYEPSARVPLLVVSPNAASGGHVSKTPVSLLDIMPTILDLVGFAESQRLRIDGASLTPLLEGKEQSNRMVFSEMHSEGVYATCFMVRKGRYKYIYIHGHDEQLFNLEKDPDEWNNLADRNDHAQICEELKKCILSQFNPDQIEKQLRESLQKRQFLKKAMSKTKRDWSFIPEKGQ
ncbi:MAG: sulfatase-like hydrolase/transferase [Planctomycetes bacterium]|nr:sulfatase-like hydrolase/transferase [Planctomycetota bacterium]